MGAGLGCQRHADSEVIDAVVADGNTPKVQRMLSVPGSSMTFDQLEAFYAKEQASIPDKIEPYYRHVIAHSQDQVSEIVIKATSLGPQGIEYLCKLLPFYAGITLFKLWKVDVDPVGAQRLMHNLPFLSNLRVLSLEIANIEDAALSSVDFCFKHMRVVRELWLGCNKIGPQGAKTLAQALVYLVLLEVLNLDENEIGNDGCKAITRVLSNMQQLKVLSLECVNIDSAVLPDLLVFAQAKPPEKLNLRKNRLNESACTQLTALLPGEGLNLTLQKGPMMT